MASSILAGFVKGFADRELDLIDERRKQEAKLKEVELLNRLQSETRRADALFEEGLPSKVLGRKRAEQEMKLAEGQFGLAEKKFALDEMDTRERLKLARQREAREAAEGRERSAALRSKGLDGSGTTPTEQETRKEVKFQNNALLTSLTTGPTAPLSLGRADQVLDRIIANVKTPAEVDRHFREYLQSVDIQRRKELGE